LPADLYIPPEALEVFLETFEGPLDLLLYLIRKHSLDILDIPMAELTRQYMAYIEMMHAHQLELAADYLVMAAILIEIKSRMLLPRPVAQAEEADPRAELMRRLVEYEKIRRAAQALDALPQAGRDFGVIRVAIEEALTKRLPKIGPEDLRNAWYAVLARAKANRHHKVTRAELSVREHMTRILRRLRVAQFVEFLELFDPAAGVPEAVVTFLAILELVKENLVEASQTGAFAPLYVRMADRNWA
jgi:segregation and condensation protein A